jgi:hypothetical protein
VSADHDAYQRHPEMFRFVADGPGGDTRSEIRAHDASGDRVVAGDELGLVTEGQREELRARVTELAMDPRNVEEGVMPDPRQRSYRTSGPGYESREIGLRALEQMEIDARSGDRLDSLIRRDRAGIDSRYIAAVSDPDYGSAF